MKIMLKNENIEIECEPKELADCIYILTQKMGGAGYFNWSSLLNSDFTKTIKE